MATSVALAGFGGAGANAATVTAAVDRLFPVLPIAALERSAQLSLRKVGRRLDDARGDRIDGAPHAWVAGLRGMSRTVFRSLANQSICIPRMRPPDFREEPCCRESCASVCDELAVELR